MRLDPRVLLLDVGLFRRGDVAGLRGEDRLLGRRRGGRDALPWRHRAAELPAEVAVAVPPGAPLALLGAVLNAAAPGAPRKGAGLWLVEGAARPVRAPPAAAREDVVDDVPRRAGSALVSDRLPAPQRRRRRAGSGAV